MFNLTTWEGIEDPSDQPQRVWFSKGSRNSDPWLPLRKSDCVALNLAFTSKIQDEVTIECGRATANLKTNVIHYNFYNSPTRQLGSAIWFQKEISPDAKEKYCLIPIISTFDEGLIDGLFKEGVNAQSSNQRDMAYVLQKEILLKDDNSYKVYIYKSNGGTLKMRKKSKNFISLEGFIDLQRGYGDYVVDGEEEEYALGSVRHLSFIIHGIGEAMWSREEVALSSLIDEVNILRTNVNRKLYMDWKQDCEKCKSVNTPAPPNRIEFIPIEWYGQIHSSSSSLKKDLISTTLTAVPKLRAIANDVLFDVLVYNTPEFCRKVLDCVTNQICNLYDRFQIIHRGFVKNGGTFSIVGHSLGSVIAWDILSILSDNINEQNSKVHLAKGTKDDPIPVGFSLPLQVESSPMGYEAYITQTESTLNETKVGTWGPPLNSKVTTTIPFIPSFTFFLGSPIGLFLTLRGARPVFNELLDSKLKAMVQDGVENEHSIHQSSPFRLPSKKIFNIFSPSDPVAYRIEPLLLPSNFPHENLPAPCYITPGGKGVRLHVKAKELSDSIMKSVSGIFKSSLLEKIPDKISPSTSKESTSKKIPKKSDWKFALGGDSDRVDFQLQPGVVENEYLAAISAHNSYMKNVDLIEFWIECAQEAGTTSVISID